MQSGLDKTSTPSSKTEPIYSLYSVYIWCVLLLLFRRSHCRVPTGTPTKPIATAGRAYGQWYKRNHSFIFRLPWESVRLVQPLLELVVYMNSSLGQDFAKQFIFLGRIWIIITIMITIYWPGKEIDWGWGTLWFLTIPFKDDPALQTSAIPPTQLILSKELSHGTEGDMIWMNINLLITDIIILHMQGIPALFSLWHTPWRHHSYSRSRSDSPPWSQPPLPQVSSSQGTLPPPYSP